MAKRSLPFGHDLDGAGGLFGAVAGQHLARIGNQRAVLLGQQRIEDTVNPARTATRVGEQSGLGPSRTLIFDMAKAR